MELDFVFPDLELNTRMARLLINFKNLSFNKVKNPVLTIEKIAVFDFLITHPSILYSVIKDMDKKPSFLLQPEELNSISAEYPSASGLFDYKELKLVLQVLLIYKFISVKRSIENEVVYYISEPGMVFVDSFSLDYFKRLEDISTAIKPLQGRSFRKLLGFIKPYLNGNKTY